MALPTYVESGTLATGTANVTPSSGANTAVDDILICVAQSENQAIVVGTPNGFVEIGNSANKAAGTAGVDPACRIHVSWKRATASGTNTGPTITDPGDHCVAIIHTFRGAITTGDPWDIIAEGNDSGANDTSGLVPGGTTTVADCLIILIDGSSRNATSTTNWTWTTNADLVNFTERQDNTHTVGLGGGFSLATGEKASVGLFASTINTHGATSFKGAQMIALKPPTSQLFTRSVSETVPQSESLTKKGALNQSDITAISETLQKLGVRLFSDISIGISETAFGGLLFTRSTSEGAISVTDAIIKSQNIVQSDTISIVEVLQKLGIRSLPETISISETLSQQRIVVLSVTESAITIIDTLVSSLFGAPLDIPPWDPNPSITFRGDPISGDDYNKLLAWIGGTTSVGTSATQPHTHAGTQSAGAKVSFGNLTSGINTDTGAFSVAGTFSTGSGFQTNTSLAFGGTAVASGAPANPADKQLVIVVNGIAYRIPLHPV